MHLQNMWLRILRVTGYISLQELLVLSLFIIIPVTLAQIIAPMPQSQTIHIESFRYGKSPAVIHCMRGDTLRLTFSSRDTGHSFFLQEFDLDVKVYPNSTRVMQFRASDPSAMPEIKHEVVLIAEHPGLLKYLISTISILPAGVLTC